MAPKITVASAANLFDEHGPLAVESKPWRVSSQHLGPMAQKVYPPNPQSPKFRANEFSRLRSLWRKPFWPVVDSIGVPFGLHGVAKHGMRSMHYERTPRFRRLKLRWLRQTQDG